MAMMLRSVWAACLFLGAVNPALAQEPPAEKIMVAVAKKKVPAFEFIKKAEVYFELQEKSKNDVPRNVLSDFSDKDLKSGFRLSHSISEGNFLTRDDLVSGDKALLAQLPPGMRAVAIKVTPKSLAGGFIILGSKVDVVWTYRGKADESGSLTILQDILVLAVDTQSDRQKPDAVLGTTVTLAVSPEDVQRLVLAASNGELTLCLRHPGDILRINLKPTNLGDLKPVTKPKDKGEAPAAPLPPLPPKEEVGSGIAIPPGMRAVALPIDPNDAASGFILPGSHVDLLRAKGTKEKIVLENVLVLAVDVQEGADKKPAEKRMTITVATTPADAVKLVEAVNTGIVRAVLRRPDEDKK